MSIESSRRADLAEGRSIPINFEEAEFVQQVFVSYVQQLCTATHGSDIEFARGRVGALLRQMGQARVLFRLEAKRLEFDIAPRLSYQNENENITFPLEHWSCPVCGGRHRNELGACVRCPSGPRDPR